MPVNSLKQAVIQLSAKQAVAIGEIAGALPQSIVALSIEETNVSNTVAVTTKRGTSFVGHNGEETKFGRGA